MGYTRSAIRDFAFADNYIEVETQILFQFRAAEKNVAVQPVELTRNAFHMVRGAGGYLHCFKQARFVLSRVV